MLIVTIELKSAIDAERDKLLGVMRISNDGTGTPEVANYNVRLSKFGDRGTWKQGRVEGFDRVRRGPFDLLWLALRALVGGRNG